MTSRLAPSRHRTALAVAAVLLLGLAACGDDGDDTTATGDESTTTAAPAGGAGGPGGYPAGGDGGESGGTFIEAQDFALTSVTVAPGAEVEVSNVGAKPHTATADDGAFDSGTIQPGASGSVTAPTEPGSYPFHCEIHPSMAGELIVQG